MRQDIAELLQTRPIWHFSQDPLLRDLESARTIAIKDGDDKTVEILDKMIQEQKDFILSMI